MVYENPQAAIEMLLREIKEAQRCLETAKRDPAQVDYAQMHLDGALYDLMFFEPVRRD